MTKLLNYNDFLTEMKSFKPTAEIKENLIVSKYFEGKINDKHLEQFLFNDLEDFLTKEGIITEGIDVMALLTKGKEAIMNWFFGVLSSIIEKSKNIKTNIMSIINPIVNVITKFTKKYPIFTKLLIIFIVIIIIMILSAQSASAATGVPLTDVELQHMTQMIDASIGFLTNNMQGQDTHKLTQLTDSLLKIKQDLLGQDVDLSNISGQLKETMKATFNYVNNTFTDAEVADYAAKGSKFIQDFAK
jgi:hypothetical protein